VLGNPAPVARLSVVMCQRRQEGFAVSRAGTPGKLRPNAIAAGEFRFLVGQMVRIMPTIDIPDDEHAAVIAGLRRTIAADKYPLSPRLDVLKAAQVAKDSRSENGQSASRNGQSAEPAPPPKPRRRPRATSGRGASLSR
jgi:hypothetical protein